MALATQCPHCHTTFRVAHDQLKLRAGLVRCGACRQIFNGIENLMRLDDAPAAAPKPDEGTSSDPVSPPATASVEPLLTPDPAEQNSSEAEPFSFPADAPHPPAEEEAMQEETEQPLTKPEAPESEQDEPPPLSDETDAILAEAEFGEQIEPDEEPAITAVEAGIELESGDEEIDGTETGHGAEASTPEAESHAESDAALEAPPETASAEQDDPLLRMTLLDVSSSGSAMPEWNHDYPDPLDQAMEELERKPLRGTRGAPADDDDESEEEPSFVREGRRRQRFGRALHIATVSACCLLLLTLLAQGLYLLRDQIAARVPASKPLLLQMCSWLDCQVGLPAQIEAVTLESSELHTLAPDSPTLLLTVLLRNQSSVAQSWPHLELTLNDAAEKPLVRRVFSPAEYLPADISARLGFPARSEQPVRLFLEPEGIKASGYRVYLFHP